MLSEDVLTAHEQASTRFVELVDAMPDDARAVPGLEWSTLEVAAHVLSVFRGYRRAATEGEPLWRDPLEGPAENQRLLDETPERNPTVLAREIDRAGRELRAVLAETGAPIRAFGDLAATPDVLLGVNLGDVLIHGLDISRGLGSRWALGARDAVTALRRVMEIVPSFVNREAARGLRATYGLTIRGGPSWGLTFDDATLTVRGGRPSRADCRLQASPVGFMLSSYGRRSQLRTALSGQIIAYGRKPWLAMRFNDLLVSP